MSIMARRLSIIVLSGLVFALVLQNVVEHSDRRMRTSQISQPICSSTLFNNCSFSR